MYHLVLVQEIVLPLNPTFIQMPSRDSQLYTNRCPCVWDAGSQILLLFTAIRLVVTRGLIVCWNIFKETLRCVHFALIICITWFFYKTFADEAYTQEFLRIIQPNGEVFGPLVSVIASLKLYFEIIQFYLVWWHGFKSQEQIESETLDAREARR